MIIENAAFIQKKARKKKFKMLFFIIGVMTITTVYLNLDLDAWSTPPIQWYTNNKKKCSQYSKLFLGYFLGLKDTFFDTSILVCIPAMIFGVSFSINIEYENFKWTKTKYYLTMIRLALGILIALSIDYLFDYATRDVTNHTTIYT